MKNIILAIASFIMTVALLVQVANAQDSDKDDANRRAAQSLDPNEELVPMGANTQASVAATGINCPSGNCDKHNVKAGIRANTVPGVKGAASKAAPAKSDDGTH
jgi:hypothetical protein